MQRIFNLFKWFGRLLLAGILILIITFVIFLNKPSLFIDDIEEIVSGIINKNLNSNIKINISSIDGDFVSGFYAKNTQVYLNDNIVTSVDSVYINPNISDLLLLDISFSNISLINPQIYHDNLFQAKSQDYSEKPSNIDFASQMPLDITIDQFFIDNGIYRLGEEEVLFNGELKCSYSESLNIDIESFNILSDKRRIFNINKGSFLFTKDNFIFNLPDYHILTNHGQGNFNYEIANKQVSVLELSFQHFTLPKYGRVEDIIINLSQANPSILTLNSSLSYNSNIFRSIITINLNEMSNGLLSTQIVSAPQNHAQYNFSIISAAKDEPKIALDINKLNFNTTAIGDLKVQCELKEKFNGSCEINSLGFLHSDSLELNDLSGIFEFQDKEYILKDLRFDSNLGIGEIDHARYSSEVQALNGILDITNVNKLTKQFNFLPIISGDPIHATINYYTDKDTSFTQANIQSNMLKFDDLTIYGCNIEFAEINKNIEYEANFYQPEIFELKLDTLYLSGNGEKNSYFNSIRGYNISTGDNIESNFTFTDDSTLSIEFIKGKLKDIPFYSEGIIFDQKQDVVTSSPLIINLGLGKLYAQIEFLDSENYFLDLSASQIDLVDLKKLFQFQDRIKGQMNGELQFSYENAQPIVFTNMNFRDGNFDDILFESFDIQALFRDSRLRSEVDINTDIGKLKLSGWLTNTGEKFTFNEADSLNISGDFDKFEISYLMRHFPWEQKTTGLLSGKINIDGKASSPRIELEYAIKNPSFDKIIAENISGNLIYKDEIIHFKPMNLETLSGAYTGTGNIPANLSFVKMVDLNILEKPLNFIITGKSNSFEFLTPYIDEIELLNGVFTMQLGLSGTLKNPIRGGQISIQNAKLELLQLDNSIEYLSGVATIASNKLIIKNLSGRLLKSESDMNLLSSVFSAAKKIFINKKDIEADNNVIINGTLDLTDFFNPNYSVSIDASDIYLNSTYGQFEGNGDAEIVISGKDTLLVTGEFRPSPHNFTLLSFGDDYSIDMPNKTKDRLIKYDIHVPFQDGIIIETDEVNMLVDGDINIISTINDEITYSGKVNIIDGTFNYNNNRFNEATGMLILDPSKAFPYAEINAQTQLVNEKIDITFIGFLDNPSLNLESTTSNDYSQSEILGLLTFNEKDDASTGQIGELLGHYMKNELEKNIALYTELDEFKVDGRGSLISGLQNPELDVYLGKRISSNLYLNTKINFNQSNKMNEYEVSYRLNKNMSIVAKVDGDQDWNINYRYKYKY